MATTTFYTHITDPVSFTCRLTQKVFKSGSNILIWCDDVSRVNQLDHALWSFQPASFIPHEVWTPQHQQLFDLQAVLLAYGEDLPVIEKDYVVINLADAYWCNAPRKPERVLELVRNDLDEIAAARKRFRTYRNAGFKVEHFDMRT
ncbi:MULTISPECIES: DNA polymerase III subunit chi [unclassified Snodgrassella]|uniref:DNA polymerase III subunit chi n=1 Tax=Snodgrassella TaxID=1193515 RepID=UPI0018DE2B3A|nr:MULTISPECIES: DNA polymerase III subunit chi [unclassified Snodgrassella]MBI0067219.1 DNA polymerase III subunit chi [Snodgrassella sp. M0110]MBI0075863.1 DNA polymerase III subunit chi [Snodgrassella sp. M0118]MBI0078520.1 DNA polymerase III subunit chi [Snodgrassella sp. M0112]